LEKAINLLDSAILIDSTYVGFFNNRGLLYYKLGESTLAIEDFKKAIQIDSTTSILYANLALALNQNESFEKACKAIKKAEDLGLDTCESETLTRIKKEKCK
jgi:tetratricopeptide (TPR) repeat protein